MRGSLAWSGAGREPLSHRGVGVKEALGPRSSVAAGTQGTVSEGRRSELREDDARLCVAGDLLNTGLNAADRGAHVSPSTARTAAVATAASPPAVKRRSMLPHEHGAWGQLAMPLLTALAIGRAGAAPLLLTVAVVLAFVAHEPLLVLLGQRGQRVRKDEGGRARRWLAALAALAAATGLAGIALAPTPARLALLLPAALAAGVGWLVSRKLEKTVAGEIAVAAALASAGYAVALAGGAPQSAALTALLAWILSFAAATLAVQVILVRARSKGAEDPGRRHAVLAALLGVLAAALSLAGLPAALALASAPTVAFSVAVCLLRVSPKRLRELGWALVGSSVVTLVILVAGLR